MVLAIGVVIVQSATRFSALALDGPSRRIQRNHTEAPLSPAEASATVTRLIREVREGAGVADSPEGAICCALEADLDAERQRVVNMRYGPGWEDVDFRSVLAGHLPGMISLATVYIADAGNHGVLHRARTDTQRSAWSRWFARSLASGGRWSSLRVWRTRAFSYARLGAIHRTLHDWARFRFR
jgi:hypothetical protein